LNIIDTPGHVDFTVEVERSLRVLDGVIAVFSGVEGVQPQSETVWRQSDRHGVARIAFVNKMDRVGADFDRVVQDLRAKLGANAWPVLIPWGRESELRGQIDVINGRAFRFTGDGADGYAIEDVPPEWREAAARARDDLVREVADLDDEVAALWLEDRPVSALVLKAAIRRVTVTNRFVPIVGGSAYRHCGVQPLLDAVIDYLPSPLDRPAVSAHLGDNNEVVKLRPDDEAPPIGLAFKVVHDAQAGRLVFVRVYTGSLRKSDTIINPRTNRRERLGRLLRVFADRRDELSVARSGDIVAISGLREFATGDTVCSPDRIGWLEPPVFPEPVVSMALEPKAASDRERLAAALSRLSDEDPTFRTFTHPETGQTIIEGMGELHLEIVRERLVSEHRVQTTGGAPEIAYRETIRGLGEADYLLRKQNGGVGMYARVILNVRPGNRGSGVAVQNRVSGGGIPSQYIGAVERGIFGALRDGAHGYPVIDVRVDILDGAAHVQDSNDLAFQLAGRAATKEALEAAGPVLLEPVVRIEVDAPSEVQGGLVGDLTRRRARVKGIETKPGGVVIRAEAPLAELWGYANAIRSLSKGRANYSMTPVGFEPVPASVALEILGRREAA
jgi:elongation factor G